jgi:hypothetical protein
LVLPSADPIAPMRMNAPTTDPVMISIFLFPARRLRRRGGGV